MVERLTERLKSLESREGGLAATLYRAAALRQSILKRAFEGRLVPQDRDDEPAAVLLERIRAEREAKLRPAAQRRRRRRVPRRQSPP